MTQTSLKHRGTEVEEVSEGTLRKAATIPRPILNYQLFPLIPPFLCASSSVSFSHVISSRPGRQQRNIHGLKFEPGLVGVGSKVSLCGLQEILIVAVRKIRLVVRAARFISHGRAL